ncbi:MAG: M48 family metalloprotease [Bacteroidales bacterium]|nr:M48 family metalloprotease [Bacteroidales bacterium]
MIKFKPQIEIEQTLCKQIYTALQGSVVEEVIKTSKDTSSDDYWRSRMEGHCMKVEKEILGDFYNLCMEVKEKLGFKEQVDFYVTGDSTLNAFSIAAEDEGHPHIVNINSALFDLMNTDELKFVVGHELGHIINKDTALRRLIYFVFPPDNTQIPITLYHKIRLHDQLAELVADRYGYMANENLTACVTAFFKMASGLDLCKMNVSIEALLEDNRKRLDYFLKDKGRSRYDHPVNPIRVQAINLFATAASEEQLNKGMEELIEILLRVGDNPMDADMSMFIATAGLIVSSIDGQITKEEIEHVVQMLAGLQVFPKRFLDSIAAQNDKVPELFHQSVENILKINPGMRESLLYYVLGMVLSDKEIGEKEVKFVYDFGNDLGLSNKEISTQFAEVIQRKFVPSLDSIC